MSSPWPTVPLGDLLNQRKEHILLEDDQRYRRVTVRLHAKGIELRDEVFGREIKTKKQFPLCGDDLLVAEIDAKVGGYGIVPPDLAGSVVSSHYFIYEVDQSRLDIGYLGWWLRTESPLKQLQQFIRGALNYAAIRPYHFPRIEIPLPPLPEQQRLAAKLDALHQRIEEARTLQEEVESERRLLIQQVKADLLGEERWPTVQLGAILTEPPRNGLSPKAEAEDGIRMLRINSVSSSPNRFVDLTVHKTVRATAKEAEPFKLQKDDVFVVRYNGDINRVAKGAIYKGNSDTPIVYPDKLIRLRPCRDTMLPDFLVYALEAPSVRRQIEELSKTTTGQIGISGKSIKSFIVPVPPIPEQEHIVAYLDDMESRNQEASHLQKVAWEEFDQLPPALLEQAFRGEL